MISRLNGPLQKKKLSKYTLTTNSYDFARKYGHYKYIINYLYSKENDTRTLSLILNRVKFLLKNPTQKKEK
jgi:hypothetical protein